MIERKGKRILRKTVIIKRRGHSEKYEERKVYASCYYACKNAHLHDKECERIASRVAKRITKFVRGRSKKQRVTSTDIFDKISKELRKEEEDAGFLYATHRDIS